MRGPPTEYFFGKRQVHPTKKSPDAPREPKTQQLIAEAFACLHISGSTTLW